MTLLSAVPAVEASPVDVFLAQQSDLTAVERFAQRHQVDAEPRQAKYYRDLLPLHRPGPGQQYGFEVDLDACTGCKACVAACHSLNGLDEGESWRSVTLLTGGPPSRPVQQTVTAACHHCVEPACLAGCPVDAYEKDPSTGIVVHLDDQCIGCSYCTLTCPYEVPVFNHSRGIVRKCDMCKDRLASGEAPACVQACPNGAISIAVVEVNTAARAAAGTTVPAGPPSCITRPTTVYQTEKVDVRALTAPARVSPAPARAHAPLAVMLVLTQLSVGAFATDLILRLFAGGQPGGPPRAVDAAIALTAGVLALGASVGHLGRPRYFYRAVIGWRHSWLSREVLGFGAFTGLAGAYAVTVIFGRPFPVASASSLAALASVAGLAGLTCSVLIYTTTHRASWRPLAVSIRFGLTAVACGVSAVTWATVVVAAAGHTTAPMARTLELALMGAVAVKLSAELLALLPSRDPLRARRSRLLRRDLRTMATLRLVAGAGGGRRRGAPAGER